MNYTEITTLALSIADRSDSATAARIDDFLKLVESRMNRKLKTLDMATRLLIPTVTGQEYYDLPSDFGGLREIKFVSSGEDTTIRYNIPEAMDGLQGVNTNKLYYTIVGNQIRISPTKDTGDNIEIVYFQRVPALTSSNTTNWMGDNNPDCYTFGLLVEISAYAKDAEAKLLWDDRFKESLDEIDLEDNVNRWSGPPLETKLG